MDGRAFLDDLLVAALQGAVPLAQMQHLAVAVAENLHLNMAGAGDETLHVERVVAECGAGLGAHHLHPAPAAACRGLQQHGKPDSVRRRPRLVKGGDAVPTGHDRNPRPLGKGAGADLVAKAADGFGPWPDEGDAVGGAEIGQPRVFREEPVARMQRIAARADRRRHHSVDVEITCRRRRRPDADRPPRHAGRHGVPIRLGGADHRFQPRRVAGADDAHGDFAAIGDEDPFHAPPPSNATMVRSGSP